MAVIGYLGQNIIFLFWSKDQGNAMKQKFDKIIIGAGLYGLYAAEYSSKKEENIIVLEYDDAPFQRATYINQARVHMGYHYPRSLTTAIKSAGYFRRFVDDFGFCIHDRFEQIYATSDKFSWTDAKQFMEFCQAAKIRCDEVAVTRYFKDGMCDGAFLTEEYTYDAKILGEYYRNILRQRKNVRIVYGARIKEIVREDTCFIVQMEDGDVFEAGFVLNATYASVNQILSKVKNLETDKFRIKYELCEIILCEVGEELKKTGITVMDGPFFSIMPFGKTGLHSLTSVTFTPHVTCYDELPEFRCQKGLESGKFTCTKEDLGNCSECPHKPETAWKYMSYLANKYLKEEFKYSYKESLFSMKPILKTSEVDDSRPTAIKVLCEKPTFISVLSGKINKVYDLDEYL